MEKKPKPAESPKPASLKELRRADKEWARLPYHMGEITWRVALPILLLCIIGIKLDSRWQTRPWLSVSGLLLSILFASLLIYRYIKINFPDAFGGKK